MPSLTIAKWVGGIVLGLTLALIFYFGLIKPNTNPIPSTSQEAQTIINYNTSPKSTFGCNHIRIEKLLTEK